MSTTGHESEAINVGGLKASMQKLKTEYLTDVAHLGDNDGSAVIADFDPQTDTVWKKAQVLSAAEKEQVQQNIGVREWLNTLTGEKYISVAATDQTTTSNLKALIDTAAGSAGKEQADTIYRVGKWDGSAYNEEYYSDYAWDGSAYVQLNKKSIVGEVFDITEYKGGTKYADLAAALGTNGANVPQNVRKGGMSVKYVNTDNKYVQYMYMLQYENTTAGNAAFVNPNNWYWYGETSDGIFVGEKKLLPQNDFFTSINNSTNKWDSSNNVRCQLIPVIPNSVLTIKPLNEWSRIAFLKSDTISEGASADFSTTYSTLLQIYSTTKIVVPSDTHYLYIYVGNATRQRVPQLYIHDDSISDVLKDVEVPVSLFTQKTYLKEDGTTAYNADTYVSEYVLNAKYHYILSFIRPNKTSACGCVFKDGNGNVLAAVGTETGSYTDYDIAIPSGTAKILICRNNTDDTPIICKGLYDTYDAIDERTTESSMSTDFVSGNLASVSNADNVLIIPDENYKYGVFNVFEGEKYIVDTVVLESTYKDIIITDVNNHVIATYNQVCLSPTPHRYSFVIPDNGKYLFVNCRDTSYNVSVKRVSSPKGIYNSIFGTKLSALKTKGGYEINNGAITLNTGAVWNAFDVDVIGINKVRLETTKYGIRYRGYIIADSSDNILSCDEPLGISERTRVATIIDIPSDAAHLYVNCIDTIHDAEVFSLDNVPQSVDVTKSPIIINICSVNAGMFNHGDGETTDNEYLANWRQMLNDVNYDLVGMAEFTETFGALQGNASDLLFKGQIRKYLDDAVSDNLALFSRLDNIESLGIVELPKTDGTSTTNKYKALELLLSFNNNTKVYMYLLHLAPSAGYAGIRVLQYQALIDRIQSTNQSAIILGDFNAQNEGEYDVFKTNGFNLANCSYLGRKDTLRNIPADNIITTSDILIKKFEVLDNYTLNTDHKPIVVALSVKLT